MHFNLHFRVLLFLIAILPFVRLAETVSCSAPKIIIEHAQTGIHCSVWIRNRVQGAAGSYQKKSAKILPRRLGLGRLATDAPISQIAQIKKLDVAYKQKFNSRTSA